MIADLRSVLHVVKLRIGRLRSCYKPLSHNALGQTIREIGSLCRENRLVILDSVRMIIFL